jgi:transketolase
MVTLNKDLKRRIIEIAYKNKLSHLGSYMSCVDTIEMIFNQKSPEDIFILSNGHAALAQYVVLEKHHGVDAEKLFKKHGGHPHLDPDNFIWCSTGSLGMGISVAVGRALANPSRKVYVMLSDGECAEGVVWESLRFIADEKIPNIKVYIMHNGFGAYREIPLNTFAARLAPFNSNGNITIVHGIQRATEEFPFLKGMNAHYHIMKEPDYLVALELTKEMPLVAGATIVEGAPQ